VIYFQSKEGDDKMKVAIVHDGLATHGGAGGAEWVLSVLHEIFPDAPIYTTVFNPKIMPEEFNKWDIRTSFIQKLPFAKTKYKLYLPLMPTAIEQFDLTDYDVVISCNHSVAKGVITRPDTLHICYCYSPLRYVWEFYYEYLRDEKFNPILKLFIPFVVNYLRLWDRLSADRVDYFIAISQNVAKRIYKHYRRDSIVIYPPIDVSKYVIKKRIDDFFLIVSRMVAYKRLDIAIEAFNELKLPLVIIGDGIEKNRLKKKACPNIKLLGRQPDEVVRDYYSRCKAFIFTSEEDFGIAPLEAQASGRPVIAYGKGGALETVIDGVTGKFYYTQTPQALIQAIREFNSHQFDPIKIRQHTLKFSIEIFKQRFKNFIKSKYANMNKEPKVRAMI
jgi:glycosyltransferase involved in cell wall biosynthesis